MTKAYIIEHDGPKGYIQIVDGVFSWAYDGDQVTVLSILKQADDLRWHAAAGKQVDGATPATTRMEAPGEMKYSKAKSRLQQFPLVILD